MREKFADDCAHRQLVHSKMSPSPHCRNSPKARRDVRVLRNITEILKFFLFLKNNRMHITRLPCNYVRFWPNADMSVSDPKRTYNLSN